MLRYKLDVFGYEVDVTTGPAITFVSFPRSILEELDNPVKQFGFIMFAARRAGIDPDKHLAFRTCFTTDSYIISQRKNPDGPESAASAGTPGKADRPPGGEKH